MKNLDKPLLRDETSGYFLEVRDRQKLFVYDYQRSENYHKTIFIISGITGINHHAEKGIIEQLGNREHRVVVIHPRGTGYSDGKRGDLADFSDFVGDYLEIITRDKDYLSGQHKMILYGHSMSTAVLLAIAENLKGVGGVILVNPPYKLKKAKGMSPSVREYLKYGWYSLFRRHEPIVNMAGDPFLIRDEEDRRESEERMADPLLVKYFSIYMMLQSRKLMGSMIKYCKKGRSPLLLVYGLNDPLVDQKGCDQLFREWGCNQKQYSLIEGGSHGKSTVKSANLIIRKWLKEV